MLHKEGERLEDCDTREGGSRGKQAPVFVHRRWMMGWAVGGHLWGTGRCEVSYWDTQDHAPSTGAARGAVASREG